MDGGRWMMDDGLWSMVCGHFEGENKMRTYLLLLLTLLLVACGSTVEETAVTPPPITEPTEPDVTEPDTTEPVTIRLMTHDSFDISAGVMEQFTAETGITVEIFRAGDGGAVLNQAILARDNPLADVLFGVDNTFLSRALDNDIFIPYQSPQLVFIDERLQLDSEFRALPVDYGDVCLNYDKAWFEASELEPPQTLADLIDPAYADLTVAQNPATSTPGLAFLLATIDTFGEDGYLDFWQEMVDNGVLITSGWEDAYRGHFSAASDGDRPIVVSYASSPPAEVYFAEEELDEAPTASVVGDGTCFRQIEFIGILRGTPHEAAAQQLVDFMLSTTFQEDIPLNMFVFPANSQAQLPDVFARFSQIPDSPANVDPAAIAANREQWIEAWTDVVLR
jgi:thiamine transport system substrate-binding protein